MNCYVKDWKKNNLLICDKKYHKKIIEIHP
jgi:hypothetical protein